MREQIKKQNISVFYAEIFGKFVQTTSKSDNTINVPYANQLKTNYFRVG